MAVGEKARGRGQTIMETPTRVTGDQGDASRHHCKQTCCLIHNTRFLSPSPMSSDPFLSNLRTQIARGTSRWLASKLAGVTGSQFATRLRRRRVSVSHLVSLIFRLWSSKIADEIIHHLPVSLEIPHSPASNLKLTSRAKANTLDATPLMSYF